MRIPSRVVVAIYPAMTVAILLSVLVSAAQAQIAVELQLAKKNYVAYEPVNAVVTVYNRSGRDVVLGGPSNTSWLQFQVSNYGNDLLTPLVKGVQMEPVMLPAQGKVTRTVDLSEVYPIFDFGTYRFRASVYFPPSQGFYDSGRVNISMADGKLIWGPVQAQRPASYNGRGMQRQYTLLKYRSTEKTEVYVRVTDSQTGGVYATYSLGELLLHVEPQATTDNEGRLHVLFYGAPQLCVHNIIDFSGKLLKRDIYKSTHLSRPELMLSSTGAVGVKGGVLDDPIARARQKPVGVRSLSERPSLPGLPGQ
jgi:hypothetical protein